MNGQWRLDCGGQSLVLASAGGLPEVIYWGPPLPADEGLAALAEAARADLTGGMLDRNAPLSLCPEPRRGFPGQPGLALGDAAGVPLDPLFALADVVATVDTLRFTARAEPGLRLTQEIEALTDCGQFRLQSQLEAEQPVRLYWLAAPVLPAPPRSAETIEVFGRWTGEFQLRRQPWHPGARLREARQGRSGHEHPPYLIVPLPGCTNTAGEAFALQYGWSGGHRMLCEELPDGRRQLQFGHAWGAETKVARRFDSAPLYATYSGEGLNGVALANQRLARSLVQFPEPARPRPVHYNCWEAVYFDHDLASLSAIADSAAALGAERFVLDDGWFGRRDDDTSSLGDWWVDRRKWPDGLTPLIDHIRGLGMGFGLWIEPEMVNPDSDLYHAHPDWALGPADQVLGRHQMVLDLTREAVRDYLFERIAALLGTHAIEYLKWDHNRLLPVADAAQTRALYGLLERLRAGFPRVEIESCASGGGRIDAGMLEYCQRIWLSDSNDALERARIQHDAALFLPPEITGSHVGPRRCHTSGRVLPMSLRARVAAQRHLGFEMDLRELTETEAATLRAVTQWWKAGRDWRMRADILRLDSAEPELLGEIQRSPDGARFTLFATRIATGGPILPRPLNLTGLNPSARYRIRLVNPEDAARRSRGQTALAAGELTLSGQALMHGGLTLPVADPATIWIVEGERI